MDFQAMILLPSCFNLMESRTKSTIQSNNLYIMEQMSQLLLVERFRKV